MDKVNTDALNSALIKLSKLKIKGKYGEKHFSSFKIFISQFSEIPEKPQQQIPFPPAAFYYSLGLASVENCYEQSKVKRASTEKPIKKSSKQTAVLTEKSPKKMSNSSKKKQTDAKLKVARDKLENLTITISNDGPKKVKLVTKDDKSKSNPMLERLRSKKFLVHLLFFCVLHLLSFSAPERKNNQ